MLSHALILALAAGASAQRVTVPFDFAWLTKEGIEPPQGHCNWPGNESTVRCDGLRSAPATTAEECAGECCLDPECLVWQFAPLNLTPVTGGCWIGNPSDCSDPSNNWVGGSRPSPGPQPHPNATGPALPGYDDHDWTSVVTPHDFLITSPYSSKNSEGNAFRSRNTSWYRKHFAVPTEWQGKSIYARFGGVFHETTAFVNGVYVGSHANGYTSFVLRLDNASLTYGTSPDNVLAMYVDARTTSSWWYAGGGIYRHVEIVAMDHVHVAEDGLYAIARVDEASVTRRDPSDASAGATGNGYVFASVEVANDGVAVTNVTANVTVWDAAGALVGSCVTPTISAGTSGTATQSCTAAVGTVSLWGVASPSVYTVRATLMNGGAAMDDDEKTVGFRTMQYSSEEGFVLNGDRVSHTGFCDHNDQAVVGMAVPDRLWLHRFQMLRAIGGNARRMSHNSPSDAIMEITDRLGVLTMPENRNFVNQSTSFRAWHDLLKHHRNHPSVAFFSECNEVGCYGPGDALAYVSDEFKTIGRAMAPGSAITANQFEPMIGNPQSITLDVQGFSHQNPSVFATFHEKFPEHAVVASECCSCESQRDEDGSDGHYSSFNADCIKGQTNWALNDTRPSFNMVGTYTWTLTDYYGEGHTYPEVGSSYGQFDRAVFPKQAAHYYRAAWLTSRPSTVPGRPPIVAAPEVSIVESWDADAAEADTRDVHVYCGGDGVAMATLAVNGKAVGAATPCAGYEYATFQGVTYEAGSITASATDASGNVLATTTTHTSGAPVSIAVSIDAPTVASGTGAAVLADGTDVAMIRATVLDANGNRVRTSSVNVTFAVSAGPGELLGCGNGDPRNLSPPHGSTCPAYHGLVRAVVRVNQISSGTAEERSLLAAVHGGAEALRAHGTRVVDPSSADAASTVTVTASSGQLKTGSVDVPLSSDAAADGVMAVAAKFAANVSIAIE